MAKHDMTILKVNPELPNILISDNKIKLFIDWYNKDIRFQNEVPHTFEKGYIILNSKLFSEDISVYSIFIKTLAKEHNKTYRQMETLLKNHIDNMNNVTIYFDYNKSSNIIYNYIYGKDGRILSKAEACIGPNKEPSPEILLTSLKTDDVNKLQNENQFINDVQNQFNYYCLAICTTCLWYLATTTNTTKYKYKEISNHDINENKKVVYVKENKTISTPIYNLSNIKVKSVDRLINKRQGYTYSHSFQVHGHFRHYSDGKVIFINPYIKGKNKPFKPQTLILDPKE